MKKTYRNIAFLSELLINILVFSVSCAVLVGVFGTANNLSRSTSEQGLASAEINALVETMRVRGVDGLEALDGAQKQPDGTLQCAYSSTWQPTTAPPDFLITFATTEEKRPMGTLLHISAVATAANGREICRFDTAHYTPERRAK